MSSRIISGGESESLPEFPWRAVPAASGRLGMPVIGPGGEQAARLREMEQELPRMIEEARQRGAREAEQASAERMAKEVESLRRRVASTIEEMLALREKMRRQMEKDLVHLAAAIARRILRRELSVDPEALTGVVRAAMDRMEARQVHRLLVAPADQGVMEQLLASMPLPSRIEVFPDKSLERGAAIFETARGKVDASVETQLQEVERGLADLVRRQA